MEIAHHLRGLEVKSPSANGRRMCSVLIILYLLHELSHHLLKKDTSPEEISMLFSMLCLQPDVSKFKCLDLQFLIAYIPKDFIKEVTNVLVHFINVLLPVSHNFERAEWFYVIPLIHMFMQEVAPFDPPVMDLKRIMWNDERIKLNSTAVSRYV